MNEERYILFDNYLQNELTVEEKLTFENQLQLDTEIATAFEIFRELHQHLENKLGNETQLKAFKENLKTISKQDFSTQKTKVISFRPWQYAVAASITIFIGIFFSMQNSNPEYADYNQHEIAYFVERSSTSTTLKEAQDAFNAKKYKEAVLVFEKIAEPKSTEINFFYAVSLLEVNDYEKASTILTSLKSGASIYKNKAIWYLALLNLKQEKLEGCKTYLKQIPVDSEDYEKAQKLLKEL